MSRTPIKYTRVDDGSIRYHHKFSTLRKFLTDGFRDGANGFILVGQRDDFCIFKGFGTIEAPCTSLRTIEVQNDPYLDGEMSSPEEIINPPKKEKSLTESYRMVVWDA